ncbi:MAG: protein kinase [Planctomycetes bacterium]|nr:protein kinase [Planctomycetota bacterium]
MSTTEDGSPQPSTVPEPLHPDVRRDFAPAAGARVPHSELWTLQEKLGQGGFGEVWRACNQITGEERAVKFCTHPAARNRLAEHEMKIVRHVLKHLTENSRNHPNVVPLLECNLSGDVPWLMYEYVPGRRTLANVIEEFREHTVEERIGRAVPLLRAIATAVGEMHRLDVPVVHRDLKPQNVLMAGDTPRITDFGIGGAAVVAAISDTTGGFTELSVGLPTLLQGPRVGTLLYASPEQWQGHPPDPRNDIFAIGVIAYQLVLGDLQAVPGADARDELADLGVPDGLASLIVRSISTNPERRPKHADDWGETVARWLPDRVAASAPEPEPPSPAPAPRSKGERVWTIDIPGTWYAREASHADVGWREIAWREVAHTPAEVTTRPGEVYRFSASDRVRDEDLAKLEYLRGIPGFKSLDLSRCKPLTDTGVECLWGFAALQSLDLSNSLVTDAGLGYLKELAALRSLALANCKRISNYGLSHLTEFPHLRFLDLHGCRRLTDAGVGQLKRLRTLRYLDVRGCDELTSAGVGKLRKALPSCVVEF